MTEFYNLTGVDTATNFNTLFSGVDGIVSGLFIYTFLVIIFIIIVAKTDTSLPKKFVIASFVVTVLSTFLFVAQMGINPEGALVTAGSLLFISILWTLLSP